LGTCPSEFVTTRGSNPRARAVPCKRDRLIRIETHTTPLTDISPLTPWSWITDRGGTTPLFCEISNCIGHLSSCQGENLGGRLDPHF